MDIELRLYDVWTRDPAFFHLLEVGLHWLASETHEISGGTLYVASPGSSVWGFVSDDLLVAGYAEIHSYTDDPDAGLLPAAERRIRELRGANPKSLSREGLSVTFAAIKSSGSWQLLSYASGDWEGIVLWLEEDQHWCGPPRHVPAWAEDSGRTTPYEEHPSLKQIWTRDPASYHLLRVGLHWYASEIRQIAGGTLYVAGHDDPVWGFVSDDLLIAGYASGPIAHLLPEAERKIGKLRGPVRSSCPDDGLDLRFVAKKVAGHWQLMFYASGDWEWVMIWLFDCGLYRCDPGRHVAQWMRPATD